MNSWAELGTSMQTPHSNLRQKQANNNDNNKEKDEVYVYLIRTHSFSHKSNSCSVIKTLFPFCSSHVYCNNYSSSRMTVRYFDILIMVTS